MEYVWSFRPNGRGYTIPVPVTVVSQDEKKKTVEIVFVHFGKEEHRKVWAKDVRIRTPHDIEATSEQARQDEVIHGFRGLVSPPPSLLEAWYKQHVA